MSFSRKTKEDVLVASKRYCCLCEVFCGLKIEIHHILQVCEGGGDSFENAIALCLNCHADMKSYDHQHPKGTKYRSTELKRRRNDLYKKVKSGLTQNHKIEISEHDKNVYSRLKSLLPWDGLLQDIRQSSFQGRIEYPFIDSIHELENILRNDPSIDFNNPELTDRLNQFKQELSNLNETIGLNTFGAQTGENYCEVPKEYKREKYRASIDSLQRAAYRVDASYKVLMNSCAKTQ